MPPRDQPRPATNADLKRLEQEIPRVDPIVDQLGLPVHYGSIEAAEEARFPWLRRRRGRRVRRTR